MKSCFQSHVNLKLNVTVRGPILDFWSCFVCTDMCLTSLMTDGDWRRPSTTSIISGSTTTPSTGGLHHRRTVVHRKWDDQPLLPASTPSTLSPTVIAVLVSCLIIFNFFVFFYNNYLMLWLLIPELSAYYLPRYLCRFRINP